MCVYFSVINYKNFWYLRDNENIKLFVSYDILSSKLYRVNMIHYLYRYLIISIESTE